VSKRDSLVDVAMLEHAVRDELNRTAPRAMAVLRPLKLVIENYPEDRVEELDAVNNPEDPGMGSRRVPFSRVLYIERDDVREVPPLKYHRPSRGRGRLRWAYSSSERRREGRPGDRRGAVQYDQRRAAEPARRRKVKSTIHWVSAHAFAEVGSTTARSTSRIRPATTGSTIEPAR
jgi:glutaminyl-tRNA synthetase